MEPAFDSKTDERRETELMLGDNFKVSSKEILGTGRYGSVVRGTWNGNAIAVKRIQYSVKLETDLVRSFNHENVAKLLHVLERHDKDSVFIYCAMELCQASLDQFFFVYGHPKRFRGPMPSRKNLFLGLAQGMEYIHSKDLIYDDIKPKNVLILVDHYNEKNTKAKWSISSGLLEKRVEKRETVHLSKEELIWKAPELTMDQFEQLETIKSNIFAVGLVFAYFLLDGKHLYVSTDDQIVNNIKNNKPVNLFEIELEHFRKLIKEMISHNSTDRPSFENIIQEIKNYVCYKIIKEKNIEIKLKFCNKILLGKGGYGIVYYGTLTDRIEEPKKKHSVAIKQIDVTHSTSNEREEMALKTLNHPNVIRLLHATKDDNYRYVALELCRASMDQLFLDDADPQKYRGPIPHSKYEVLYQLAEGLKYIHSNQFIHRDIKPSKALFWVGYDETDGSEKVLMKWTGFGLSKQVDEKEDISERIKVFKKWTDIRLSKVVDEKGTSSLFTAIPRLVNWNAPELVNLREHEVFDLDKQLGTPKSDVFSEGLVFGYFLLNGKHPYGSDDSGITNNILLGNVVNINDIESEKGRKLISQMLATDTKERIDSEKVVELLRNHRDFDGGETKLEILIQEEYCPFVRGTWRGNSVAVKQIPFIKEETKELVRSLDHENVVKLFHVESPSNYCAMELCQASLDQFYLDDDDPKKFHGPMPSKKDLFLGLSQGMEYIHSKNLIYSEIKPNSVLILVDNGECKNSKAKWSISNLLSKNREKRKTNIQLSDEEASWKAPEIIMGHVEQLETIESNIFAVGLVFAYILLGGKHLYDSTDHQIVNNIKKNKPVNIYKIQMEHYRKLISGMVSHDSANRPSIKAIIQQIKDFVDDYRHIEENSLVIKVFQRIKLGKGRYGIVFYGTLAHTEESQKRSAAVKRMELIYAAENDREEAALKELCHSNVVRLFHATSDNNFRYYALELCQASMEQLFLNDGNERKYRGPMPHSKKEVLCQLAKGLKHIHSKHLIHRDIKPANALIWVGYDETRGSEKVLMKWADFGLSKRVNEKGTCSLTGIKGTTKWNAPELLELEEDENLDWKNQRGTTKSDVFAEGLVFAYYLLDGIHPYGLRQLQIPNNILNGHIVNMSAIDDASLRDLIKEMLVTNPKNRISSSQVVEQLQNIQNQQLEEVDRKLIHVCVGSKPTLNKIQTLLLDNPNVNCVDEEGLIPFFQLIQNRNFDGKDLVSIARFFIEKSMKVNFKTRTGQNALHFLCRNFHLGGDDSEGLIEVMRLLIAKEIDVNYKDNGDRTALHVLCRACANKNLIKIIRFLVKNGLDVHSRDREGWNALHHVCENYHQDDLIQVIRCFLVEYDVDINSTTNNGENILHILCRNYYSGQLRNVIYFLINQNIDVNCRNKEGKNAYDILAYYHKKHFPSDIVKLFAQSGMDIDYSKK